MYEQQEYEILDPEGIDTLGSPEAYDTAIPHYHPAVKTEPRYHNIEKHANSKGFVISYFQSFEYSKHVQFEPDEMTEAAQCRKEATDKEHLEFLKEHIAENGLKMPPIGVYYGKKVYVILGNHRVITMRDLKLDGPMIVIDLSRLTYKQALAEITDIADMSNSKSETDILIETNEDIINQLRKFVRQVNGVDLNRPDTEHESRLFWAFEKETATKKGDIDAYRRNLVCEWLKSKKAAMFSGKTDQAISKLVTKIVHQVWEDYDDYGSQKYDYNSGGGFESVAREIFKERLGFDFPMGDELENSDECHGISLTADIMKLLNAKLFTIYKKRFSAKELSNPMGDLRLSIKADPQIAKLSSRHNRISKTLEDLTKYNKGESYIGTGILYPQKGKENIVCLYPPVKEILFCRLFNDKGDSHYAYRWNEENEKFECINGEPPPELKKKNPNRAVELGE